MCIIYLGQNIIFVMISSSVAILGTTQECIYTGGKDKLTQSEGGNVRNGWRLSTVGVKH